MSRGKKGLYQGVVGIDFKPDVNSSVLAVGVREASRGLEVMVCVRSFDNDDEFLDHAENRMNYDFFGIHFSRLESYFEDALVDVKISSIRKVKSLSRTALIWYFKHDKKKKVYDVAEWLGKKYSAVRG